MTTPNVSSFGSSGVSAPVHWTDDSEYWLYSAKASELPCSRLIAM
jgi:hypothetical protein